MAVRDTAEVVPDRLQNLSMHDVELVIVGGCVHLASQTIMERLPEAASQGLEPLWIDGTIRWLRAPVRNLLMKAEEVLGKGDVPLGGQADPHSNIEPAIMRDQKSHFGVLSFGGAGHLNSLLALSRRLVARGHRVTFFQRPELEARVRAYGIEFSAIGTARPLAKRSNAKPGVADLIYRMKRIADEMGIFLKSAPDAISRSRIDALIIDEIALFGPTLAQLLNLPYILVSTSVPHNFGWEFLACCHSVTTRSLYLADCKTLYCRSRYFE